MSCISKEVYYWSTTIDGVYHKCSFLKEKEDGRTVEGDDLQTCRVTGEVLVMSSQVIDDHAAVGTVNLIPAVRGSITSFHLKARYRNEAIISPMV